MTDQAPAHPSRRVTPGQTIGPFFGFSLPYEGDNWLVQPGDPRVVRLHGTVLDGRADPVPDALVEIWQAGPDGDVVQRKGSLARGGSGFTGFGRCATDREGGYSFLTLEPGSPEGAAPFFAVVVFARGLLDRLFTRAYLPADRETLAGDRLLSSLPSRRRGTLIATREDDDSLRFDIRLQGEAETVFLDHARQ